MRGVMSIESGGNSEKVQNFGARKYFRFPIENRKKTAIMTYTRYKRGQKNAHNEIAGGIPD